MVTLMVMVCAAAAGFLSPKGTNAARRRLDEQFDQATQGRQPPRPRSRAPDVSEAVRDAEGGGGKQHRESVRREAMLRRAASAVAGVLCWVAFGGLMGGALGVVVAVAVWYSFGRLGSAERRRRQARLIADLPVAVDLLAACLRGGAPWHDAVEAVADAVGGPLGEELRGVAVQIRLGADPVEAWLALTDEPILAPLARTAVRAVSSGAALAPTLGRLARDQRRVARTAAAARARAAGVRALAPLGLCFLPAFVLLGVVPAIAGIASTILVPW
ncbi:type II secretion system F family protein [Actinomadura montaniterrae]|uniref:Type II secretion system F family protein n=1 Tax=Actinomadura montaniterrae TaxID=1803903 RepID=A0A6L3VQL1_9ACTN|nr:type II secretion system F family protein [Actinomadura montaniterrae]KAB2373982.1 type II secretion system F family protein [Actinomadura montaniterrae]